MRCPTGRTAPLRCRGFTLTEAVVALGVLGAVLLTVAQVGHLALRQRQRHAVRQEALEAAANVLEAARACPWDELTPAWAGRQRLPEGLVRRLRDGRLEVRVEPESMRPHTRRIRVAIRWALDDGNPARPVELVSLRSARTAAATGGEP
jgi:Prokaryotic N-terminal methylation motif